MVQRKEGKKAVRSWLKVKVFTRFARTFFLYPFLLTMLSWLIFSYKVLIKYSKKFSCQLPLKDSLFYNQKTIGGRERGREREREIERDRERERERERERDREAWGVKVEGLSKTEEMAFFRVENATTHLRQWIKVSALWIISFVCIHYKKVLPFHVQAFQNYFVSL